MTAFGACEWCGHFDNHWDPKHVRWTKNVRRPVGDGDPKKYILDQIYRDIPEAIAEAGVRISRLTAERMRNFMEGFRVAHAGSEDPYEKGWHDAMDFMIRSIDKDLERYARQDRTTPMTQPEESL